VRQTGWLRVADSTRVGAPRPTPEKPAPRRSTPPEADVAPG
jgi:hypothetical protein